MRIGLFQTAVHPDDFDANLAKFVEGMQRADADRVEIVAFPECFLTGFARSEEHARRVAIAADSPQIMQMVDRSSRFDATAIVGFGEVRGGDLYNTAAIVHKGHLLGLYSKSTAYERWEKQGRQFPVFERGGVKFGVIICSDGGYIEPARILAAQGAQIVFAPHFNLIEKGYLLKHFRTVRSDHTARAVENTIYFVRANNFVPRDPKQNELGYGDSYIVDPYGEILVRARQYDEHFLFADIDPELARNRVWNEGRSVWSHHEFGKILDDVTNR
jgi:predicted amidohydrolase